VPRRETGYDAGRAAEYMTFVTELVRRGLARCGYRISRLQPANRFQAMGDSLQLLRASGYRPAIVIDAGANVGEWTRLVQPIYPSADFHLIEPQVSCQAALQQLTNQGAAMHIHPVAITEPGVKQVRMLGGGAQGGSTGAWVAAVAESGDHEQDCLATTLDELLADRISPSDRCLLKLDLETHELAALRGAARLLRVVEVILTEAQFYDVSGHGRPTFTDVLAFLRDRDFELFDIASLSPRPRDMRLRLGDAILGMTAPIRLTAVLTHPVQYYAPWFRYVASECPEIHLTVIYAVEPSPEQQGVGFAKAFSWDIPLTDGYNRLFIRKARAGENLHSSSFLGVNVPEIGTAIRGTRPDIVLVMGWYSITLLRALWSCRRMGLPVLYRGDTNLLSAPAGWTLPLWSLRTRLLLRMFSAYLSTGRRSRQYLRRFGVRDSLIFHTPHCVDNAFFAAAAAASRPHRAELRSSYGLAESDFVVLFAGKLDPGKRPLDAIHAVHRLGKHASLLVVGSGKMEQACRAEAESLGARVVFAGFLNQSQIGKAYAAADSCLLQAKPGGSSSTKPWRPACLAWSAIASAVPPT
jgi:FkbM family methyltransferase